MLGIEVSDLVGIAGLGFILVMTIISVMRGWFIPAKTFNASLAGEKAHADKEVALAQAHAEETRAALAKQLESERADTNSRMESFRQDHALRVDQAREDHEKQLAALALVTEGVRKDFATVLAARDSYFAEVTARMEKDIDHWRGAFQLSDQAEREEIAGQLGELVAGSRAFARWVAAFQDQTGVPQLPTGGG